MRRRHLIRLKSITAGLIAVCMVVEPAAVIFAEENPTVAVQEVQTDNEKETQSPGILPDETVNETKQQARDDIQSPVADGYLEFDNNEPAPSIHTDEEPELLTTGEASLSYYKTAKLPAIRNQAGYGVCWAFSTIGLVETNLMKKGYSEMDLSEMHLANFTYRSVTDPLRGTAGDTNQYTGTSKTLLQKGGNYSFALNTLVDWSGAAEETIAPYNTTTGSLVESAGLSESMAYQDKVHVQNFYKINMSDTEDVKNAIVNYGAVGIDYYALATYWSNQYYNASTSGYYCYNTNSGNHAVSIVGWDDDYAASNFPTQPDGNGAWIVRNSWGTDYGDDGYFYLSYYDKSISTTAYAVEAELADNYDNNYEYDGSMTGTGTTSYGSSLKAANIFTAGANTAGAEQLKAISFEVMNTVNADYKISIYKNITDDTVPDSGVLCTTQNGSITYTGNYTIPLENPVYLDEGTKYSVVIELTSKNGSTVFFARDYGTSYSDWFTTTSTALENQSFLYSPYSGWSDYGKSTNSNIRIKAFTDNSSKASNVAVTGITLQDSASVNTGDTVKLTAAVIPSDATNASVTWKSSDDSIASVAYDGTVTGKKAGQAKITATSVDGNKTATCVVTVKQPLDRISMNYVYKTLKAGDTAQLAVYYYPSDTTDSKNAVWSSADSSVVKVDQNGKITAVAPGTTVITAQVGDKKCTCEIVVEAVRAMSVQMNSAEVTIKKGGTIQLSATVYPTNTTNKKVIWKSSDSTIAVVNQNGLVTGKGNGKATITVTTEDGGYVATTLVTVVQPLTAISLDKTEQTLHPTEKSKFNVIYTPSDTSESKSITWSSSATNVATVSSDGTVTAIAPGKTTIMAKVGTKTAMAVVTVEQIAVTGIVLKAEGTLEAGKTTQITATVSPSNATYKTITWYSSNTSVATVSNTGLVKGIKAGTAVITAKADGKIATFTVTVKKSIQSISISTSSMSLTKGSTGNLSISILPQDTSDNKTVTWKSADTNIATVDQDGVVTAVATGKTTVTATVGSRQVNCSITVSEVPRKEGITVYNGIDYACVYDKDYYYDNNEDVAKAFGDDPEMLIWHFVTFGMSEGRCAKADFNVINYRYGLHNGDLRDALGGEISQYYYHYMNYGRFEGRSVSDYDDIFDADYYLDNNPDVLANIVGRFTSDGNLKGWALWHYCEYGMSEGRSASAKFGIYNYLAANADVYSAYSNNLKEAALHYLNFGRYEGRTLQAKVNMNTIPSQRPDVVNAFGSNPINWVWWYIEYGCKGM